MHKLLAFLLLFVFAQTACATEANSRARIHAALQELTIEMVNGNNGGNCTAYAVGPHAVMTAEHCFDGNSSPALVTVTFAAETAPQAVTAILRDGNDHVLVIFKNKTFSTWVSLQFATLEQGERVFVWGNPSVLYGATDCYREGYYSGRVIVTDRKGKTSTLRLFAMPAVPGDSGALIFNQRGEIVGVVSRGQDGFTGSYDFTFTAEQLAAAAQ